MPLIHDTVTPFPGSGLFNFNHESEAIRNLSSRDRSVVFAACNTVAVSGAFGLRTCAFLIRDFRHSRETVFLYDKSFAYRSGPSIGFANSVANADANRG